MSAKLLVLALCASALAFASADVISQVIPGAPVSSIPAFIDPYTFDRFDTALGTLTQVRIIVNAAPSIEAKVTNPDEDDRSFTSVSATISFNARFFPDGADVSKPAQAFSSTGGTVSLTSDTGATLTTTGEFVTRSNGDAGSVVTPFAQITLYNVGDAQLDSFKGTAGTTLTGTGQAGSALVGGDGDQGLQYSATSTIAYTIELEYTYTAIVGDPQFSGFQGQSFQVHGVPDAFFNLISTPEFFVNSRFVYLASGVCDYDDTPCWTHPGTYIDRLAFSSPDYKVEVLAGAHAHGLKVLVNGKHVAVNGRVSMPSVSNSSFVSVDSASQATIAMGDFTLSITNSDLFFNIGTSFNDQQTLRAGAKLVTIPQGKSAADADKLISKSYPERQIHGLLGQTWRNIRWPNSRMIEGDVADYEVADLWASDFVYTQYIPAKHH